MTARPSRHHQTNNHVMLLLCHVYLTSFLIYLLSKVHYTYNEPLSLSRTTIDLLVKSLYAHSLFQHTTKLAALTGVLLLVILISTSSYHRFAPMLPAPNAPRPEC